MVTVLEAIFINSMCIAMRGKGSQCELYTNKSVDTGEQTLDTHYFMFHWLSFEGKRLLQTVQNCLRFCCQICLLPQISSRYKQQLLLTILPTGEEILSQWI
jgi:hypothetical protein